MIISLWFWYIFPNDIECLFTCLLVICISSLEKCLFRSFACLKIVLFIFLLLSCKSSLYILDTGPYQICDLQIFSLTQLFTFLMVSFEARKFFSLWWNPIYLFFFCCCAFVVISEELLPNLRSWWFTLVFLFKSFIVLALRYRYFIHFELILGMAWDRHPNLYYCLWICSCPSNICWRGTNFSWYFCWKSVDIDISVYFCIWNSSPLIYMSVFMSVPLCAVHCIIATLW